LFCRNNRPARKKTRGQFRQLETEVLGTILSYWRNLDPVEKTYQSKPGSVEK